MIDEMKITAKKLNENIRAAATLENAIGWQDSEEKFCYCIDLLEVSAHDDKADRAVDILEAKFEKLLSE